MKCELQDALCKSCPRCVLFGAMNTDSGFDNCNVNRRSLKFASHNSSQSETFFSPSLKAIPTAFLLGLIIKECCHSFYIYSTKNREPFTLSFRILLSLAILTIAIRIGTATTPLITYHCQAGISTYKFMRGMQTRETAQKVLMQCGLITIMFENIQQLGRRLLRKQE